MRFSSGDFKATFEAAVNELINEYIEDRTARMCAIQALTDEYVIATGERPDPAQLERLTDYVLREEILDDHPDKLTRQEYPFFSERQLMRRHTKERPLKVAEEVGTDGRDYRIPKRRKRSYRENLFVDKNAQIRNTERKRRYREFTRVQPVKTYRLNNENK